MKQELMNHFKRELEQEKQRNMELKKHIDDGGLGTSLSDSVEELSAYDQHPADIASEVFERSKDMSLREDAQIKLNAIDHAFKRMNEGTYGKCDMCGREIPVERLEAIPYTTQCVNCHNRYEEVPNRINVRPVEEDILEPPFARTTGQQEGAMYDTEDAWQELAKWQEHSPHSGAGSYYGGGSADEEAVGYTELVDHIPYEVGDDGIIYEETRGTDDEDPPRQNIAVGLQHKEDQRKR